MGKRPHRRYLRDIQGAEGKLTAKTGVKELTEQPLWNQVCTLYLMLERPDFIEVPAGWQDRV